MWLADEGEKLYNITMAKRVVLEGRYKVTDFPFHSFISELSTKYYPQHSHDFSELAVILGGTAVHEVGAEHYPIRAGDVFVINGNVEHGFSDMKDLRICNIAFKPDYFFGTQDSLRQLPGFQALFVIGPGFQGKYRFESKLTLKYRDLMTVENLVVKISEEFVNKPPGHETCITGMFLELAVFLSRGYTLEHHHGSEKIIRLADAVAHMESNISEQVTLEQLAEKACLSKNQFTRVFSDIYGTTPIDYLIHLRVRKAAALLQSDLQITEIAFMVGFSDSSHFSKVFSKIMGKSPRDFRGRSI